MPFYVLERQKYVNLRKICPSMDNGYPGRLLDFQNSEGRILQGGKGKIPGVESPVGAMLWDI